MIELTKPIKINRFVRPVCLSDGSDVVDKAEYVTVGWGFFNGTEETDVTRLYKYNLHLFRFEECGDSTDSEELNKDTINKFVNCTKRKAPGEYDSNYCFVSIRHSQNLQHNFYLNIGTFQ